MTAATPRKSRGRVMNGGSPLRVPSAPKKMSSVPDRSISTGKTRTKATSVVSSEESETDAEEAGEQDEVREIRKVEDVRPDPSNQSQLQEEHQKAERDQPDALRLPARDHD